jgi:branched-chain amino acid aminotransferase
MFVLNVCYVILSINWQGGLAPIDLKVETYFHRAAPGGTGGVKTISNYAPVSFHVFT